MDQGVDEQSRLDLGEAGLSGNSGPGPVLLCPASHVTWKGGTISVGPGATSFVSLLGTAFIFPFIHSANSSVAPTTDQAQF